MLKGLLFVVYKQQAFFVFPIDTTCKDPAEVPEIFFFGDLPYIRKNTVLFSNFL